MRAGEITIDYIPTFGEMNLRGMVSNFLNEEKILTTKPASQMKEEKSREEIIPETKIAAEEMPTENKTIEKSSALEEVKDTQENSGVLETESNTDMATQPATEMETESSELREKEDALRKVVNSLFREAMTIGFEKIKLSRATYGKQLKIETQHEHDQSRLSWFTKKLRMNSFTKKANANAEILKKAKDEYELNLDNFRNVINDQKILDELVVKSEGFGDRGLEIIAEEKAKLFEEIKKWRLKK